MIDHSDTIRVAVGSAISGVLTIGDLNLILGIVVAVITAVYLLGCIINKHLEIVERRIEIGRLREKMEREAERVIAEKINQIK